MASKFQNRLAGTVILVAISVIVLPSLLDGKKKNYKEKFADIPLVPKSDDHTNGNMLPPIGQALPETPPEGAMADGIYATEQPSESHASTIKDNTQVATKMSSLTQPQQQPKPPRVKSDDQPKQRSKTTENKQSEQAPAGQAFVVQLGVLKNAKSVNEIIAKLRLSGFDVYTVPTTPGQGQLTRIYVGPDASKEKMEAAINELKEISGLVGVVKPYRVR